MTWGKGLVASAIILGTLALLVFGLRERPPPPKEAHLSSARKGSLTRRVAAAGKLEAVSTVKISSNLSGNLIELPVKAGDRVKKGQLLGRIDRQRFEASVRQARAARAAVQADHSQMGVEVERARLELGRVEALAAKGISSAAELDRVHKDLDVVLARQQAAAQRTLQSSAALDEAENNLSKTTLYSPIEGTVIEVSRTVGERVRGSDFSEDVVMVIAALASMQVKIEVGEHEVVHLAVGQKAEITLDALEGKRFDGTVVEIAQKATIKNPGTDAEVTTFPVTVALTERPPAALPGMSAEVQISAEHRDDTTIVPLAAVTVRAGDSKNGPSAMAKVLFIVGPDQRVKQRAVKTGLSSDTDVEILEGVTPGERVVEGPYRLLAKELADGDLVEEGTGKRKRARGPGR